jgi:hypothetical protein
MALRSFHDADGVLWHVWNVIPANHGHEERRRGFDRRCPDPVLRWRGPERRVHPDRRRASPAVAAGFAAGWLAFECSTERRRLVPIPPHWDRCPEPELARLCARAQRVQPSRMAEITPARRPSA